jgi:exonuclease VII small subunit
MEQIKSALTGLEQAVLKLESAVHSNKKEHLRSNEQIIQLKAVIRRTYERLDKALTNYQKGEQ